MMPKTIPVKHKLIACLQIDGQFTHTQMKKQNMYTFQDNSWTSEHTACILKNFGTSLVHKFHS